MSILGRKGDLAKATVLNKISEIYPDAIFADKKLYVWMKAEKRFRLLLQ